MSALLPPEHSAAPVPSARCTALPFRKVRVRTFPVEIRERVAAATTLLVDAKLTDDQQDERGPVAKIARLALRRSVRRSRRLLADTSLPDAFDALSTDQAVVEAKARQGGASLDELAQPTRKVLSTLFEYAGQLTNRNDVAATLRQLGATLGEVIYLLDAIEDFTRDRRRARFNALIAAGYDETTVASISARLENSLDRVRGALAELAHGDDRRVAEQVIEQLRVRTRTAIVGLAPIADLPPHLTAQAGICDGAELCCVGSECAEGGCTCCGCISDGCVCNHERRVERKRRREERKRQREVRRRK